MAQSYRIKEFSKLTGVTIRALQYYDKIGLMQPKKSSVGYRLYSDDDLLQLQQITTLKFMGFSLDQIKSILTKPDFNLTHALECQSEIMAEEAEKFDKVSHLIKHVAETLKNKKHVDWQLATNIIEVMNMKDDIENKWHEKYFQPSEIKQWLAIAKNFTPKRQKAFKERWFALLSDVENHLDTDPEGKKGQYFAKQCMDFVNEVYGNKQKLADKVWGAYKSGVIPKKLLPFKRETIIYLDKALKKYKMDHQD